MGSMRVTGPLITTAISITSTAVIVSNIHSLAQVRSSGRGQRSLSGAHDFGSGPREQVRERGQLSRSALIPWP